MKIKKKLVESKLFEDDNIDPQSDSVKEIADAVQDAVEDQSDGEKEISKADAVAVATETKEVSDIVNAGDVVFQLDPDADYSDTIITNRLYKALNKSYARAKVYLGRGAKNGANILVEGLPGAGKTAIVESWCNDHGLKLVALNATDPKVEAAINGMPLRDMTKADTNSIAYAYNITNPDEGFGALLNPKYAEQCVLFVDELNRQKTVQLRRPFMSLFNEKRNADGSLNFVKNLLFSVVCINPAKGNVHDSGVGELVPAEINRFISKQKGFNSNNENFLSYMNGWSTKKLLDLGVIPPDSTASKNHNNWVGPYKNMSEEDKEYALEVAKIWEMAKYLVNNIYESDEEDLFDTIEDAEDIYTQDADYVTIRSLTDALAYNSGDKDEFLTWLDEDSGYSDERKKMFHDILDRMPWNEEAIIKKYNLDKTPAEIKAAGPAVDSKPADDAEPEEDDDATFYAADNVSGKNVKSPLAADDEIEDIVHGWGN